MLVTHRVRVTPRIMFLLGRQPKQTERRSLPGYTQLKLWRGIPWKAHYIKTCSHLSIQGVCQEASCFLHIKYLCQLPTIAFIRLKVISGVQSFPRNNYNIQSKMTGKHRQCFLVRGNIGLSGLINCSDTKSNKYFQQITTTFFFIEAITITLLSFFLFLEIHHAIRANGPLWLWKSASGTSSLLLKKVLCLHLPDILFFVPFLWSMDIVKEYFLSFLFHSLESSFPSPASSLTQIHRHPITEQYISYIDI